MAEADIKEPVDLNQANLEVRCSFFALAIFPRCQEVKWLKRLEGLGMGGGRRYFGPD